MQGWVQVLDVTAMALSRASLLKGLLRGPVAIQIHGRRQGVFLDVEGIGSLITALPFGPASQAVEVTAHAPSACRAWHHQPHNINKAHRMADRWGCW